MWTHLTPNIWSDIYLFLWAKEKGILSWLWDHTYHEINVAPLTEIVMLSKQDQVLQYFRSGLSAVPCSAQKKKHMRLQQASEIMSLHTWIWYILNSIDNLPTNIPFQSWLKASWKISQLIALVWKQHCVRLGLVISPLKNSFWLNSLTYSSALPAN